MNSSARFSIAPQVVAREVGKETVLLDLASGTYFGLDPVGARIWRLLENGKSFGEVCEAVEQEYEAARETIEGDARDLIAQLVEKQLIATV